jgi:hypothetical protein
MSCRGSMTAGALAASAVGQVRLTGDPFEAIHLDGDGKPDGAPSSKLKRYLVGKYAAVARPFSASSAMSTSSCRDTQ